METNRKNNNMDSMLKSVLYTRMRPDDALHSKVLERWKEGSGIELNRKQKMKLQPVVAMLCVVLIFLGGTAVYAAANDLSIAGLFQRMWQDNKQEIMEKYSEEVKIVEEKNTMANLDIKPVRVISDSYVTYLVLRVTGKNGFQLTDNMVVGMNYSLKDKDDLVKSCSSYFLKREGNTIYYALYIQGELKKSTVTFSLENFYLVYGGYDEDGWINKLSDNKVCDGEYRLTFQSKVNSDKLRINIDGATYDIYTMGVHVNMDVIEQLDNPDGETWWDTNAAVVLKDGSEVDISPRSASDSTECILREPVDLENVKGIRIGNKEYDLE